MTAGRHRPPGRVVPSLRVPAAALDTVSAPAGPAGVVLGADPDGAPVTLALLRPAPTRAVVLGALHLARQVALRAAAAGARLQIVTGRPATWDPVARAVDERADPTDGPPPPGRVRVTAEDPGPEPGPRRPGDVAPVLSVHDRGAVPVGPPPPREPWRTTLLVLPALSPAVADAADDADVVLLGRMPPHEAELAARLWRLDDAMSDELRALPDRGVVALGRDLWHRIDLVTAPQELAVLGPVRRA